MDPGAVDPELVAKLVQYATMYVIKPHLLKERWRRVDRCRRADAPVLTHASPRFALAASGA